ncbi:hypothetical protein Verru16b_03193 [Lacunisphaera limnophila]|uniref:Uncharacterized protein n=1 Tax=Lacunisphaera limnophila TaxID=1838286 RepID=A0A1D8AYY6_9BACT|nr:protein DpdH [Lacunisphaera limnophila]AOS46097.1 hypothetical protein Verru16b_03193 [Lacunisphaera limnophila]
MAKLDLKDFWPTVENCRDCLFTEAEVAEDAVFLAVHQPMRILWKLHGVNTAGEVRNESDVLKAFLTPNPQSETLILPVIGGSGVGKSHLIRWLHANLRLRSDHATRHVVRIPKSASLRRVLDLILEELPDKEYGALRLKLAEAQLPPSLLEATRLLQANLLVSLKLAGQEAEQRRRDKRPLRDDDWRIAHCSDQGLIALLQDPQLGAHFAAQDGKTKGVLTRIADRCLHGSRDHDQGPQNQFFESDLAPVLLETQTAKVTRVYLGVLKQPKQLAAAVGFLNEVVDRAVAQLVDFRGVSLSELFEEIRRKLFKADRELVLLVEDFAVLAGIQGHLLDAMIKEGKHDGKQELCTMRTALAVTEGRLPESVMTRAKATWEIEHKPFQNETEAVNCFTDFVGGYLNAARWGADKLRKAYTSAGADEKRKAEWIPNFYDEHNAMLTEDKRKVIEAFGKSTRGDWLLFPFNRDAVHQLARKFLRAGDTFKYEPRLLINQLLRETLIPYRESFARGEFPPPGLHQFSENHLAVDVGRAIKAKAGASAGRVAVVAHFWGGDPRNVGQAAAMSPFILPSFGLPSVNWDAKAERRPIDSGPTPPTQRPTAEPEGDPEGPWRTVLDEWRTTGRIGQGDANRLRSFLDDAIHEWLDWEALLLRRVTVRNKRIYLPGAQQSNPVLEEALAVAATEADLKDGDRSLQFFGAMRAVARYHTQKSWGYAGGEQDEAIYANFVEHLATQAAAFYRRNGSEIKPEAAVPLAQALLLGARVLNLRGASANTDAENLAAIFAPVEAFQPSTLPDGWTNLRSVANQTRTDMQTLLLKLVGARQGGGQDAHAVNAVRLTQAIVQLRKSDWQLGEEADLKLFRDQSSSIVEHLRELKKIKTLAEQRKRWLLEWRELVIGAFGENFEPLQVGEQLREIIKAANDEGVFRPKEPSHESLRVRLREMGPIKDNLLQAAKATEADASLGVVLSAIAQSDEKTIEKVRLLVEDCRRFLKDTTSEVNGRLEDTPASLDDVAEKLDGLFKDYDELWAKAEEGTP